MILGLGLGAPFSTAASLDAIRALFSSGEQGAWYDPSDMSTLWQDSAGTVPVTAVEQPVGLILDKSGRGNHATQATTTKRPALSRRVNLLTGSEFRNWLADVSGSGGLLTASALPGYAGAITFGSDGITSSYAYKYANLFGAVAVLSVVVKMTAGSPPVTSGAFSAIDFALVVNGNAVATEKMIALGDGCYRVFSYPQPISGGNIGIVKYNANSRRTFQVTAYDLRPAADANLHYQRVHTATDYDADPAKFPAYLRWDGVDDALQTGNIDFTGTDKMTVLAGVYSTPGSTTGTIVESSTGSFANNGAFALLAHSTLGAEFSSRGTILSDTVFNSSPAASPSIVAASFDIGGGGVTRRVNSQQSVIAANQGTGQYGNYPLYIGARAGIGTYLDGRLYSLIVRGAHSTLSQIEGAELYMKKKAGIA